MIPDYTSFSSKITNYPRNILPDSTICGVYLEDSCICVVILQDSGFVNVGRSLILQDS